MECSLPGSSIHGIFQARVLEWGAIAFSISILEHYNLLSKQPNYTCGLFFFDLMFMVVSWARAIMSISKKAWTFPGRPYYYILYFQKLIAQQQYDPRKKGTYWAPGTTSRGRAALQIPFSSQWLPRGHIGPLGQPHVRKSCLAGSSLILWPCHGLGTPQWLPTFCVSKSLLLRMPVELD